MLGGLGGGQRLHQAKHFLELCHIDGVRAQVPHEINRKPLQGVFAFASACV